MITEENPINLTDTKKIFKKAAKEAVHALKTIKIRNMPQAFAKEMKADRNVPPVSAMIKDLKEMKKRQKRQGEKRKNQPQAG